MSRDKKKGGELGSHGPVQDKAAHFMREVLRTCREAWPGMGMTIFLFEPEEDARRAGRERRMNYASTVHREDMLKVLRDFVERNERDGEKLDRIADDPPTGTRQ